MKILYRAALGRLEHIRASTLSGESRHVFAHARRSLSKGDAEGKDQAMFDFALDFVFVTIGVAAFAATALYLKACASL